MYFRQYYNSLLCRNVFISRPYFTYWVTFVQIMVYLIAVSVYGIAPIGFEETEMSSEVCYY